METLVERKLLGMSLQQLELRCTSNTVHYVLNEEDSKDPLLISNELKKVLSKTPKFRPTPNVVKSSTIAKECDLFGYRLIKTFTRFVCKEFIEQAKYSSKLAGIIPWKLKEFPHNMDYYALYNQKYFDLSKPFGYIWRLHHEMCPGFERFILNEIQCKWQPL